MVLNFKCIVRNTRLPRLDVVADPSNTKPTLFERKSPEIQHTASWVTTACDGVQSRANPS